MKKANLAVSVLGILMGLYIIVTALGFPENNSAVDPGPGYFPMLMGGLLIVLCAVLAVLALMGKNDGDDTVFALTPGIKRAALGVVGFFVYCLLFKPLGFVLDTAWFCFACMYLLQNRKYVMMAITSIATSVVIYIVFASMLGAKLPAGLLKGIL